MADRTIYINPDGRRVDSEGNVDVSLIQVAYKTLESWDIHFIDNDGNAVDVSDSATWRVAVDDDIDDSTTPWIRIEDADIDSTDSDLGIILFNLDSEYEAWRQAVDDNRFVSIYLELFGYDSSGDRNQRVCIPILAVGGVDNSGGQPTTPSTYYSYSKDEADARFAHILSSATENDIVLFDGDGDIKDSGHSLDEFETKIYVDIDYTSAGSVTVYSVPTGYIFKPIVGDLITTDISGVATLPKFKWMAGSSDLTDEITSTMNAENEYESDEFDSPQYYTAGTIISVVITDAGTSTTHTGQVVLKGVLISE